MRSPDLKGKRAKHVHALSEKHSVWSFTGLRQGMSRGLFMFNKKKKKTKNTP